MRNFLLLTLLTICFISCKKRDDEQNSAGVNFSTYQRFDATANYLGTEGDATDDYKMEDWPQWVFDMFKPLDTVNLIGYEKSVISIDALYPNPCADTQSMRLFANQPVNLKMVMIDVHKNVVFRKSFHIPNGIQFLGFSYAELALPPTFYRMFYAFSAEDDPYFLRGHIDINKVQ
jgi:hypothetical protein